MNEFDKATNARATKLICVIVFIIVASICLVLKAGAQQPFAGSTKHKTIKKMSKRQVRNAQKGKSLYYYSSAKRKVVKNKAIRLRKRRNK
jgi:hypothetical protein